MANRYSQYIPGNNYAPESFKDLAVVPIALRQRHDAVLDAQDNLLLQLNNIQVRDDEREYYNQKRAEITAKVEGLTNKINTIGAGDANLMGEFRNMKRDYNKEVSLTGGLGQAADIKKRIDDEKARFLEHGVKQGFSPEIEQKNFDIQLAEYNKKNPNSKLGEDGFAFGQTNFTFAPKKIEAIDIYKEGQSLLGDITKDEAWSSYQAVYDDQGRIDFVPTSGRTLKKDNLQNLEAFKNYVNQKLLNPESDVRQSLRRSRPGVDEDTIISDFMKESDFLKQSMRIKADSTVEQVSTPNFPKDEDKSKQDEATTLVSTPTGQAVLEGQSIIDIASGKRIAELEAKEKTAEGLTQEEINEKNQKNNLKYRIDDALKDPKIKLDINKALKNLGINLTGDQALEKIKQNETAINNIINSDTYDSLVEKQKKHNQVGSSATVISNSNVYSPQEIAVANRLAYLTQEKNTLGSALNELYKSIPKDDLIYSKLYTVGAGEPGKKAMDIFNANATDYGANWVTLLKNSGGNFSMEGFDKTFSTNDQDDEPLKLLETEFAKGATVTLGGVIDRGTTGSSQILVNFKSGTGDKSRTGTIAVDYDNKTTDSDKLDNWLIELQKTMDFKGQAIIQSIIDNKQLSGISTDNTTYTQTGFSSSQSNTIKSLRNQFDSKYKNSPEFNAVKYTDAAEYNIIQDKEGYHSLYIKRDKNKPAGYLSTGDWLNKQFAKNYYDKTLGNPNILKIQNSVETKQYIKEMLDFATLTQDDIIQVDDNSTKFQNLREDYIIGLNTWKNNLQKQKELTIDFYNGMKSMKIASKNKKHLL